MKRLIPRIALLTLCVLLCQACNTGFVDLGLPSGTLWKATDEKGGFFTYDQAISRYGSKLPTDEQWAELWGLCDWTWTGRGYKVTGMNGNSIYLPAAGYRHGETGYVYNVGKDGRYWTSKPPKKSGEVWCIFFDTSNNMQCLYISQRSHGLSVRLVQD